jgi:hypothetical protein
MVKPLFKTLSTVSSIRGASDISYPFGNHVRYDQGIQCQLCVTCAGTRWTGVLRALPRRVGVDGFTGWRAYFVTYSLQLRHSLLGSSMWQAAVKIPCKHQNGGRPLAPEVDEPLKSSNSDMTPKVFNPARTLFDLTREIAGNPETNFDNIVIHPRFSGLKTPL